MQKFYLIIIGLSFVSLLTSISLYVAVFFSNLFTYDWDEPIWKSINKVKLGVSEVVIYLFLCIAIGGFVGSMVAILCLGNTENIIIFIIPCIGMVIFVLIITSIISIWVPVYRRFMTKRLLAQGVSLEEILAGQMIGISSPEKNNLRLGRGNMIEEDIGCLWLKDNEFLYIGDAEELRLTASDITAIERKKDWGSIEALFGAVHVIIVYKEDDEIIRLRLHPTSQYWTVIGETEGLDILAEEITEWWEQQKELHNPKPPPLPSRK
ncbi:MAG: hypothetical protein HRT89_03795 [Lentisphaeria bacterium]|nr:hypothetical protein [Lentisphaeria bacterium]NQZ67173.1 hypothetical protein [Lentisphaeria bacterium]